MRVKGYEIKPGAKLQYAYLQYADLQYADLRGADLQYADLQGADLQYADLHGTDLRFVNLSYANLNATCLDRKNTPNGKCENFERPQNNWCVGYRTSNSPQLGGPGYKVGEYYEAPYFSTSDTECHPGIFVLPSQEEVLKWGSDIVKVIFRPWECHRAGSKWRVRWLIVWGG